jgi:pyruvate/2-oxoglutarate dehydrogenase complex dihydrolipoamide dehydrogenase (E3) component
MRSERESRPFSYDAIPIGDGLRRLRRRDPRCPSRTRGSVVNRDRAGGRCPNYAWIPAKTVLPMTETFHEATSSADLGVAAHDASLDWPAVGRRRAEVSESLPSCRGDLGEERDRGLRGA